MCEVTTESCMETIKVFLATENIEAKRAFLLEVAKLEPLHLAESLMDNDLLDVKLKGILMASAIKVDNMDLVKYLYSRLPTNIVYITTAAMFEKPDVIFWIGTQSSDEHERNLALTLSAQLGRLDNVKALLDLGIELHPQAFVAACGAGHLDIVQFLEGQTTDLSAGLCEAVQFDKREVVELLLGLNRPVNYAAAISRAAYCNKHELLASLIILANKGQPIRAVPELSRALTFACSKGYHQVVNSLLGAKVPLEPKVYSEMSSYDKGTTKALANKIIQVAVVRKDLDMVKYLKNYFDHVNLDKALRHAVLIAKDLDMVKILTSGHGNQPFNLDKAIMHAISIDSLEILTYLTTIGRTFDVVSAIEYASLKGCNEAIIGRLYVIRSGLVFTYIDSQEFECCVCMGVSETKVHPCNHAVCMDCAQRWVIHNTLESRPVICPMCRTPLLTAPTSGILV